MKRSLHRKAKKTLTGKNVLDEVAVIEMDQVRVLNR